MRTPSTLPASIQQNNGKYPQKPALYKIGNSVAKPSPVGGAKVVLTELHQARERRPKCMNLHFLI